MIQGRRQLVRRGRRFWPAPLVVLLCAALAGVAAADPDVPGLVLPGLDPFLHSTDDPRLLGVERMVVRERMMTLGVDPADGEGLPTPMSRFRKLFEDRLNVDMEREAVVVESSGPLGVETTFRYPEWFFLFQQQRPLPGGFYYYPPRDVGAAEVDLFVDDLTLARDRRLAVYAVRNRLIRLNVAGAAAQRDAQGSLVNLTLRMHFPRTLEKIIGKGEKTNIKISGREHISIGGESTVSNRFTPSERRQSQSLFPSLDMEQQLQINLTGQIGEKILLDVNHNSEMIGPEATKIQLRFQGNEDDVIRTIETGDVGLTLPGSQLLGYSSNKSGLFGLKVTGQVGRADFTVVASKQKSESSSKSFNSTGGTATEHVIEANRYLNNRFFRLDLPLKYLSSHGFEEPDSPGRDTDAEFIDLGSIQIFRFMGSISPQATDVQNVVAIPDHSGRWEEGRLIDAVANPPQAMQYGEWWRPIQGFELLKDEQDRLVAVDLKREYDFHDVLAVIYRVLDADGEELYRVGDFPGQDDPTVQPDPEGPTYYRMKLLKPQNPADDTHLWQYVLRNIYPLGGTNIDAESFTFSMQISTFSNQPHLDMNADGSGSGLEWFRVFGFDQENQQGIDEPDGLPDVHDQLIFDLTSGLLKFPLGMARPFDSSPELYEYLAGGDGGFVFEESQLADNLMPSLYEPTNSETELRQDNTKFRFVVSHAAASSSFNLGAMNIEEDSETVTLDGRTLVKDVDYEINYEFGEVTLKGEAAAGLSADSQIGVNYQYAPFLGGGNSSLMGVNLGYELNRESKLSTTWLYESNQVVGHKAKLGEEPSRTLVGNVNGQFMLRPSILTSLANILSRHDSDRESTVQLSGELALSIPNPNTFDDAHVEDFEGIDSSDLMPVTRLSWNSASEPVHDEGLDLDEGSEGYDDLVYLLDRDFTPENRVETRWFLPRTTTQRRYLNPDLIEQEGREAQQVLQIHMRAPDGTWEVGHWGGIMRGLGRSGIDLTKTQFLEFWVNDFHHEVLGSQPRGTLHFDFGYLSEDFYWPLDPDTGEPITGTDQEEDGINGDGRDGIFTYDEDIGLGADPDGVDHFSAEYNTDEDPYPWINGTARNNREDTEDLDGDTIVDDRNGYYTISVDLDDAALVDVLRDYPPDEVSDNITEHRAWRKYRVRLGDMFPVSPVDGGTTPSLSTVTHMRIWYEDRDPVAEDDVRDLELSEIKFLGSRWEREGVRRVATGEDSQERLLEAGERGSDESFFLGEVNNKENPDYEPPFDLYVLNDIPEKESSLVLDFKNVEPGHLVRVSRLVSPLGDDYTRYNTLSWYLYNPHPDQADLDVFYRVGADTLNYYEINYRFDESSGARTGWKELRLDMAELSNAKLAESDPETGWIETEVSDADTGEPYRVRVVGSPDLRRVSRLYFGVRNTARTTPATGVFWFNDVKLRQVKREMGMAERLAVRVNMSDRIRFDVDWAKRDAEFHGLNASVGQGYTNEDLNLSASFQVNDFIPLLGFNVPVSLGRQEKTQRPKYVTNSDIEIIDDVLREKESTINERENFSVRLNRPTPSGFAPLRYVLDPWTFSYSGSNTSDASPLSRGSGRNRSGALAYNLRLPPNKRLGDWPWVGGVPVLKGLAVLPTSISFNADYTNSVKKTDAYDSSLEQFVAQPTNRSKRGTLNGKIDMKPLTFVDVSLTMRSQRDPFREQRLAGFNVGRENIYNQSVQVRLSPPSRLGLPTTSFWRQVTAVVKSVQQLKPSVTFNGTYKDDQSPGIARTDQGDAEGTHTFTNSGDWNVRFSVPVGRAVARIFPEKRNVDDRDRQRILRDQRNQSRRGGGTQARDPRLDNPNISDEERRRIEDEIVQEALAQEEEERRRRVGVEADADTTAAEPDQVWDETSESTGGRFPIPNPLNPLLHVLRGIDPITVSYATKEDGGYVRAVPGYSPDFWYRVGLAHEAELPDSLYVSRGESDRTTKSLSTKVKLSRWMSVDVKYNEVQSGRINGGLETRSESREWPDLRASIIGLEKIPFLGGGGPESSVRTSNLDLSFKKSTVVNGITETIYNPKVTTQINPRWTMTFRSGLSTTLNVQLTSDETENNGTLTDVSRFNVSGQVRHSFGAERLLTRLGLYKPGNSPKINMEVDVQFSTDTTKRWLPGDERGGDPHTQTGITRISVNPRFSYNITRNLSGAMRMRYSRDAVRETDTVTQVFGLGFEATFVF